MNRSNLKTNTIEKMFLKNKTYYTSVLDVKTFFRSVKHCVVTNHCLTKL